MAQIEPFTFKSTYMTSGMCISNLDKEDSKPRTITYDGTHITITYDESGKTWAKMKVLESAVKQESDKYVQWFACEAEDGIKKIVIKETNGIRYYGFNDLDVPTFYGLVHVILAPLRVLKFYAFAPLKITKNHRNEAKTGHLFTDHSITTGFLRLQGRGFRFIF